MDCHFVVQVSAALLSGLLSNHPDTRSLAGARLGWRFRNYVFKTRHAPQSRFECFTGGYHVGHGRIVKCLVHNGLVVGGALAPGRIGKVDEDGVVVQRPILHNELWVAPYCLV